MRRSLLLTCLFLLAAGALRAGEAAKFTRTEDVIYGRKFGTALTLDVFKPESANGYGVIFCVSGGFFSSHDAINPAFYRELLNRGYTVFAVVHGSQPRFIIPEIQQDLHRAVRFIRHNAAKFGIEPEKLGITGGSAGGHLSLTLGTQGGPGRADAKDPVDRESSAVGAVACLYPPTDFLNWSKPGEDWIDFEKTRQFAPAFGPKSATRESRQELGTEISPINFVTAKMAPTLILHGDADGLVPIYQAQIFENKCKEAGALFKLVIKPGADHGWPGIDRDIALFADWFDEHLRGVKK
jgi:acetyl esterase/lipase